MDRYIGMINDTEKDWQCSRHREIEYGCHMYGTRVLLRLERTMNLLEEGKGG